LKEPGINARMVFKRTLQKWRLSGWANGGAPVKIAEILQFQKVRVTSEIDTQLPDVCFHADLFIHLSVCLNDRSKASSKASSPHSAIQSFLLQMTVSSPFKVIQ